MHAHTTIFNILLAAEIRTIVVKYENNIEKFMNSVRRNVSAIVYSFVFIVERFDGLCQSTINIQNDVLFEIFALRMNETSLAIEWSLKVSFIHSFTQLCFTVARRDGRREAVVILRVM